MRAVPVGRFVVLATVVLTSCRPPAQAPNPLVSGFYGVGGDSVVYTLYNQGAVDVLVPDPKSPVVCSVVPVEYGWKDRCWFVEFKRNGKLLTVKPAPTAPRPPFPDAATAVVLKPGKSLRYELTGWLEAARAYTTELDMTGVEADVRFSNTVPGYFRGTTDWQSLPNNNLAVVVESALRR